MAGLGHPANTRHHGLGGLRRSLCRVVGVNPRTRKLIVTGSLILLLVMVLLGGLIQVA